jgi:fatty acid desaturase
VQENLRDPSVRPERAWRDALTREEMQELLRTNNWRGGLSILLDWGLVFGSMALVVAWPNLLTVALALLVIGARQLGFAVMMHEAAHGTLFANRKLNDWAGNWLCAFPIWTDLRPYRAYHLQHHAKNWTADDPDLNLAVKHPVTPASMRRKLWRDVSGQVGWKRVKAVLRRDLSGTGFSKERRDTEVSFGKTAAAGSTGWENLRGVVISNAVLLLLLTAIGHPALYLLWVVAWFTTNSLVTRLRAIAEHNMVPDRSDELRNTRTMLASWWERLLIAPNRVNYHLEHHLLMTVPFYNLPRMHRMLQDRGALDGALVERDYLKLLIRAGSKPAEAAATA